MKIRPLLSQYLKSFAELLIILAMLLLVSAAPHVIAAETLTENAVDRLEIENSALAQPAATEQAVYQLIIDDIICHGNQNTDCLFITNKFYQKIGDVLNPEKIQEAKLRLSTLNQFRNISVRLEKGRRKGHVIVVFQVVESDSLQFEFSSHYSSQQSINTSAVIQRDSNSRLYLTSSGINQDIVNLAARVTNYNFLGSGKQFSALLSTRVLDFANLNQDPNYFFNQSSSDSLLERGQINTTTLYFDYLDPHLLNTAEYFFAGQLGINYADVKTDYLEYDELNQLQNRVKKYNDSYYFFSSTIGFRFAEYSSLSVTANKAESSHNVDFGINYAWNSQDDSLFPTQGSFFRLHYKLDDKEELSKIRLDFQKNHKIADSLVVSYGLGENILDSNSHQLGSSRIRNGNKKSNSNLFVKLSGLLLQEKSSGDYSGWNLGYSILGNRGSGFFANYVHHTDKLIFNIGFTYYPAEEL